MRLRVTFAKTEAMRFTSHLDLHHTWERTFRRTGLPLAYSQGFNPRPRINLASALPLGFTSEGEVMDAWLEQEYSLQEVQTRIEKALSPGLKIIDIQEIDLHTPTLQAVLESSEFIITLLEPLNDLELKLEALLTAEHLLRKWRNKAYDLRPLIQQLCVLSMDEQGQQRFMVSLAAREGATGRPEEVVTALGISPGTVRIHRQRLVFHQEESGGQ
jgi:radical SAM-linked protein